MRALLVLLLPLSLAAQGAGVDLDLRTRLGSDPAAGITLVLPGCWDGLLLGAKALPARQQQRSRPGKTVEIWDFALRESELDTGFRVLRTDLREKLSRAWELPPTTHQSLELWEFMASDPSKPQDLELDRVKSMQERFNRLPPSGSPVTTHRP